MKRWRVGTLSMGLSLIFLGIVLFLTQMKGMEAFDSFIAWWPILLVLLGLEIILYFSFSRKENSVIYYDFLSVFFVGFLYVGCLGFAFLTSIGVIGEIRQAVAQVERTLDMPDAQELVEAQVKRVIVQTSGPQVKIDKTTERTMHLFGSYRERLAKEEEAGAVAKDQLYTIKTVGDTMYVQIKQLPMHHGIRPFYPYMNVTLVLPQDVQVEVRGADNRAIAS